MCSGVVVVKGSSKVSMGRFLIASQQSVLNLIQTKIKATNSVIKLFHSIATAVIKMLLYVVNMKLTSNPRQWT